jgi:O-succinylbenzoic acid--CoA ligase
VSATFDMVRFWALAQPDRVAVRQGGRSWTYAELNAAVQESADAFLDLGLGAGEHVALEFEAAHSIHFATAVHALHRIDLLPVPIGASLPPETREAFRKRAMVDLALTGEGMARAEERLEESGGAHSPSTAVPLPPPGPLLERRLDSPAALCFTSGTSGEPRPALLTHGNFLWSAIASARNLGVREDDLWLCCLPTHHVGGLSILTRSAYYGTAVLFHDGFDAERVNHAIDEEGVTLLSLVPPLLERLLRARNGRPVPASFRAALIGGGPIPTALLEEAVAIGFRALPTYGLTEATSQVTTLSPREWPSGLGTAGKPLAFMEVRIRDESGRALGSEQEGEIAIRGPMVMAAYFEDRERDAASWDHRWLLTGDFGALDREGRLVLTDRREDRIVVGGENVHAAEVERAMADLPAVVEVCVVGVGAGAWGHDVAAAVVLAPGASLTLRGLRDHLAATLPSFQLPRRLAIVERLPRSPSGKLLRRVVRDYFLDQVPQEERA